VLTPDDVATDVIGEVEQPTVVIGHTHTQFDRRLGSIRLVNAGSVGMPYENGPGAYWALLDNGEPELRRTEYDLNAAAERVRASGWPIAERWIQENLLTVPKPREAAEFFERQRG
jgi:diadenosine tetraphosphatase ApaH/serine/threonine PP2A family protein phosphatase